MKRSLKVFVALAVSATALTTTSCEKFLDVNQNPNNQLTATPQQLLPNALKVTADNFGNLYNTYGNWSVGYWAKSGTVNGFPEERTYNYTSLYQQALWNNTYDNIYDYDLIEKSATAQGLPNIAAIATIMKAYNFQLLVDEYGDIPYSQALQGSSNIVPKYDAAADIYKDLIAKLNGATTAIANLPASTPAVGTVDIMFGGTMTNWAKFANTLKLRMLLRQSNVASLQTYIKDEMAKLPTSNAGFLTADAAVNPGYAQATNQQNPLYNRYGLTPTGGGTTEQNYQLPTEYIINAYQANKDPRLTRLYSAVTLATNPNVGKYVGVQLGGQGLLALPTNYSRLIIGGGLLKGFNAPVPLMLAAESYFLQAEAKSSDKAWLAGGDAQAKTDYTAGIRASFVYFYNPAETAAAATVRADGYLADNATNPKVNWETGPTTKLEKIIFQKYLALNTVSSIEAWSEYRRTGFPKTEAPTPTNGAVSFTSLDATSTNPRADKLPVRLLYPQTEVTTNAPNIPAGISQFTSKIFWDVVD